MQLVPKVGEILLDRYYVEEILKQGRATATMKCFDTRLDVECVLKMMVGDDTAENWKQRQEKFVASFRAQARLNHPNIVHVSNIEMKGGTLSVMELLQGQTLEVYRRTSQFAPKEMTELFLSIIDAVSMAHSMNIIHKGISPDNILLNEQGNRLSPRILNFAGYYETAELDPGLQLPYLAPEQIDSFDNATEASDVFSLCACMYYAFTGFAPIQVQNIDELRAFYSTHDGVMDLSDSIPGDFAPLIQIGLSVNPAHRFQNATELLDGLKKIGSGFRLSANLTIDATKSSPAMAPIIDSEDRPSESSLPLTSMPPSQPQLAMTPSKPYPSVTPSKPLPSVTPSRTSSTGMSAVFDQLSMPSKVSSSVSQSILSPFRAAGDSASVQPQNPSGLLRQMIPGASLPGELETIYKIRRLDSVLKHAWIGAVSTIDNPDELYGIKCFIVDDDVAKAVFDEGMRRAEALSTENSYFQSIYARYPESHAYLMPDMKRQTLTACIHENGAFEPAVAVQIAILIGQAMEFAHQHGFVNGSLKPTNIIFENHDGVVTPMIYDFGQRLYVETHSQLMLADLPFVAPELRFDLQNTNAQADIFSFGMCLYYMLTGKSPYQFGSVDTLAQEILSKRAVPDINNLRPNLPPDLVQVIRWCTEFDPANRYARFADVLRDLYVVFQALSAKN